MTVELADLNKLELHLEAADAIPQVAETTTLL